MKVVEKPVPAATVLPIEAPMLLLDNILDWGGDWLEASVATRDSALFAEADGSVPAWLGLEYMAQAMGALAGIEALESGRPIIPGFLLGTRRYQAHCSSFPASTELIVTVREYLRDQGGMAVFDAQIQQGQDVLAEAQIKMTQGAGPQAS